MKKIELILLLTLLALVATAQQYATYQTSEARITTLGQDTIKNEKLPGTVIILSNYSHQLEVRTVVPSTMIYPDRDNVNYTEFPISLNLKMFVAPNRMQRYLTSESVFTTNGILELNNISKPVSIQYAPFPVNTENDGQMLLSLMVIINLSDFFPVELPNKSIAFVINNGKINRQ